MTYQDFENNLKEWATARNIHTPASSQIQILSITEEWGEACGAYRKGKTDELPLEIGDVFVTLQVLALQNGCKINYSAQNSAAKRMLPQLQDYDNAVMKQACHVTHAIGIMQPMNFGFYRAHKNGTPKYLQSQIREIVGNLIIFAYLAGIEPLQAMQAAWEKISQRKGKTVNGTFVKAQDINQ